MAKKEIKGGNEKEYFLEKIKKAEDFENNNSGSECAASPEKCPAEKMAANFASAMAIAKDPKENREIAQAGLDKAKDIINKGQAGLLKEAWLFDNLTASQKVELYLGCKEENTRKWFRRELKEFFSSVQSLDDDVFKARKMLSNSEDDALWVYLSLAANRNLSNEDIFYIGYSAKSLAVWEKIYSSRGIQSFKEIIKECGLTDLLLMNFGEEDRYPDLVVKKIKEEAEFLSEPSQIFLKLLNSSDEKIKKIGLKRLKTLTRYENVDKLADKIAEVNNDNFTKAIVFCGNLNNNRLEDLCQAIGDINKDLFSEEVVKFLGALYISSFQKRMAHFGVKMSLKTGNEAFLDHFSKKAGKLQKPPDE